MSADEKSATHRLWTFHLITAPQHAETNRSNQPGNHSQETDALPVCKTWPLDRIAAYAFVRRRIFVRPVCFNWFTHR